MTKKGNLYTNKLRPILNVLDVKLCPQRKKYINICCHWHFRLLLRTNSLRDIQMICVALVASLSNQFLSTRKFVISLQYNYQYFVFLSGSRGLDANLTRAAIRAAEWLRNYQNKHGTYGEGHVNGFAFSSLRLVGHSVEHGAEVLNAEIIKQDGLASIPGGPLAVYILGALATCHDPWKFYGLDLVTSLYQKLDKFPQVGFNHPFQYSLAIIALCTAGKDVGQRKHLNYIIENIPHQTAAAHASGDTLSMHIFALTCVKQFVKNAWQLRFKMREIQGGINAAIKILYKRQLRDATFGENEVTAALSYQASKVDLIFTTLSDYYRNL